MLRMLKRTQMIKLLIGQPRNFTSVRGITRIIFISHPHKASYSMDPGITFPEDKLARMLKMYNNVYTTTHIRLRDVILIKHRHKFAKFQVLTAMLLKI